MDSDENKKSDKVGHRLRLKKRYINEGLDSFEDYSVLELLLFYIIRQKDTKAMAKALIKEFGSFHKVLEAPIEKLKEVQGIGNETALFLKLLPDVFRYYKNDKIKDVKILDSVDKAVEYLTPKFIGITNEIVYIICLDSCHRLISCSKISEGIENQASVSIKKIVEEAIKTRSTEIMIAHNHPKSLALPSRQDVVFTRNLKDILKAMSIDLVDHLVFDNRGYFSMLEKGFI